MDLGPTGSAAIPVGQAAPLRGGHMPPAACAAVASHWARWHFWGVWQSGAFSAFARWANRRGPRAAIGMEYYPDGHQALGKETPCLAQRDHVCGFGSGILDRLVCCTKVLAIVVT